MLERNICPQLEELEISSSNIEKFEKFLPRLFDCNKKRTNPVKSFIFEDITAAIELENDLVFIRHRLPNILWKSGVGVTSLTLMRKDVLKNRSEANRKSFKEAAAYLLSDRPGTGQLAKVIF